MPFSPASYDPRYYDTSGITAGSLLHDRASTVWALAIEFDSGYPVTYPRTFDAAPFRLSSLDVTTDGTSLGAVFHEGRLLEAPVVVAQALDEFTAVRSGETLRFRCVAAPTWSTVNLHAWVGAEHRGKPITGWLVDLDPSTLAPLTATKAFSGELLAMSDDPGTADILVRVFDVLALTQAVPTSRIDASWAPYAPPAGLGQIVPHGTGIGRRIRCHPIKVRSVDGTLISYEATASAASDTLTIAAGYDWETGDGPVRVTTTGTLPGGLSVGVDYFAVVVNDTTLRLATTRGNALAGTFVGLASDGTGTLTVASGLAPNLDDHTDFVVGVGNVTVNQVWLDGETEAPEWPLDYEVLTQAYRVDGRYLTVIRIPGDVADVTVDADVLRVDPDVDGSCILDLKFARGFLDDARQATIAVTGATTADLVRGAHRFGLGALRCEPAAGVTLTLPSAVRVPTRSIHLIWTAPRTTDDCVLYHDGAISLTYSASQQSLQLIVRWQYQAGDPGTGESLTTIDGQLVTQWIATTSIGSVERGEMHDILIRHHAGSGLCELLLGTIVQASHTKVRPFHYLTAQAVAGPLTGTLHRLRVWAAAVSTPSHVTQWLRWRRNGIAWLEELCRLGGLRMEPTATAWAQAVWHLVESGSLVVDGWMTQETELRAALLAVMQLRSVRLTMDGGLVTPYVPVAAPPVTAALGHGDQRGNLVELPTRARASKTEAPSKVIVRYRRERAGEASDYSRTAERVAFAADGQPLTIDAPFVDDPTAADIVCDWMTKRLVARDQLVQAPCGREGRDIAVGDRVTLDIPAMGIAWDAETIVRERGVQRQGVTVAPWASSAFTYTPAPLAPDPIPAVFEPLTIGPSSFLRATLDGGLVTLEVVSVENDNLFPIADGPVSGFPWPTLVGAATAWEAVADSSASTYIACAPADINANAVFRMETAQAGRTIVQVNVSADVRSTAAGGGPDELVAPIAWGTTQYALTRIKTDDVDYWTSIPTGSLLRRPRWNLRGDVNPTGVAYGDTIPVTPWTPDRVNALYWGLAATPQGVGAYQVRLERFVVSCLYSVPVTRPCYVRIWRAGPPSPASDDPPAESVPARVEGPGLGPFLDTVAGQSGDEFTYWARVYDGVGRLIKTVTLARVVVP